MASSLLCCLSAWFFLLLASSAARDASATATKHTSSSTSNATALLLLLLLHPTTASALGHHLFFHHVNDFIGDPQVFNGAATNVALWHPPELVSILLGSNTLGYKQNLVLFHLLLGHFEGFHRIWSV